MTARNWPGTSRKPSRTAGALLYRIDAEGEVGGCWQLGEQPLVIGRGEGAVARVDDAAISRRHFSVSRNGSGFRLEDLGSSNGTWINGKRVKAHELLPHEIISAGNSLFYYRGPRFPAIGNASLPPEA